MVYQSILDYKTLTLPTDTSQSFEGVDVFLDTEFRLLVGDCEVVNLWYINFTFAVIVDIDLLSCLYFEFKYC